MQDKYRATRLAQEEKQNRTQEEKPDRTIPCGATNLEDGLSHPCKLPAAFDETTYNGEQDAY